MRPAHWLYRLDSLAIQHAPALTRPQYHADTSRISKSGLDLIARSPLHYWDRYLSPDPAPRETKKFFDFGDVANDLLLLPDEFSSLYAIIPEGAPDRPSAKQMGAARPSPATVRAVAWWNDFSALHAGKEIVSGADYDTARRMVDAVKAHPPAAELFARGMAEQTIFFDEPATGAKCKIRPDWIATDARFLVDFKTAKDASPGPFGRAAYAYRYDVQGAFYYDGFMYASGLAMDGFAFVVAEKTRPWPVKVYYLHEDDIQVGRRRYLADCETYVSCRQSGIWPGYGDNPERLQLPPYAFK